MTDQIQYLVEFTIVDGKAEEFKSMIHSLIEKVNKNEPGMDSYQLFLILERPKVTCWNALKILRVLWHI